MREILFRGKDVDSRNWVYGFYYQQSEFYGDPVEVHAIITSQECLDYDQALFWYSVIPETVGQFTGLTDKNGKKIFEGDIVRVCGDIYVCKWDEGNLEFSLSNHRESFGLAYVLLPCKVIGNIHDNPELLEVSDGN